MPKYFVAYAYIDKRQPNLQITGNHVMWEGFPMTGIASIQEYEKSLKKKYGLIDVTITNFILLSEEGAGE